MKHFDTTPITVSDTRKYKYSRVIIPIRKYLQYYCDIDVQPVGQRLDTQSGYGKKAKGIIDTILMGINIGEITIHQTDGSKFAYESIDGGHRKRYIKGFYEGLFPNSDGLYFRDLSSEDREFFLNTELSFVIYADLSVYDIGYIFRTLNETTDVNHQEEMNSYGAIPIATAVRQTVRSVAGIDNSFHDLFKWQISSTSNVKKYEYLQFDNLRLRIDEMVARLYYRYYDGGGLGRADEKAIEELYVSKMDEEAVAKLEAKVTKCLDFVRKIAEKRKIVNSNIGLSQAEFSLYTRLWLYMEEEYGSFNIPDHTVFYETINKAFVEFTKPAKDVCVELQAPSPFDAEKTMAQQFRNTLGEHKSKEVIETTLKWLIDRVDMTSIVVLKDPKRFFPRKWREMKLAEQDYKCAVYGTPLTMDDAHGGHIVAHAYGGRTTYDNLAMVSAEANRAMGTMSVEQYKELVAPKA